MVDRRSEKLVDREEGGGGREEKDIHSGAACVALGTEFFLNIINLLGAVDEGALVVADGGRGDERRLGRRVRRLDHFVEETATGCRDPGLGGLLLQESGARGVRSEGAGEAERKGDEQREEAVLHCGRFDDLLDVLREQRAAAYPTTDL